MSELKSDLIILIKNLINKKNTHNFDRNKTFQILKYGKENRLLYYFYRDLKKSIFLENELEEIKKFNNLAKIRYLEFVNEISSINKLLVENNINPIFLKGAYFFLKGVQDRYCQDIDILISRKEFNLAIKVLLDNGYKYTHNRSFDINTYDYNKSHQIQSLESVNGITIDLHHRLTSPSIIEDDCLLTENVIRNPERINFGSQVFLCPDWNDAYLHISYHAIMHNQFSVGPIYVFDLNYLLNLKDIKIVNFRDYGNKFKNLLKLSLGISRFFEIKDNINIENADEFFITESISLLFAGKKIKKLNRRYKIKHVFNAISSLKFLNILDKLRNLLIYIPEIVINYRNFYKIYIINNYLDK